MKHQKLLAVFCLFASSFLPYARAQTVGPITITSSAANSCALIDAAGLSVVGINVSGTWTGTLQPEAAIAGQSAANVQVVPSNSTTPQGTITANGAYTVAVAGWSTFLLCGPTSTGSATIYLKGSDKAISSTRSGGGGGGGSLVPGVQGEPVIYTATSTAGASNQSVDASAFAGANWLVKAIAGCTALSNSGTVLIPDSLASTSAFPSGTIPSNCTLSFTGSGTFGVCTITTQRYTKIFNNAALLQMDSGGSGCVGILLNQQATLQTNDRGIYDRVRIDCNSQSGAIGFEATAATAEAFTDNLQVSNCPVKGLFLNDAQFSQHKSYHGWNNGVNLAIYNTGTIGSGNSNTFDKCQLNNPTLGVNALVAESSSINGQDGNVFNNCSFQNGSVAELAVVTSTYGNNVHLYGGDTEVGCGGGASTTIDGWTINRSMFFATGANATIDANGIDVLEATCTPLFSAAAGAIISTSNIVGGGNAAATIYQTDGSSATTVRLAGYQIFLGGTTLFAGSGTFTQTGSGTVNTGLINNSLYYAAAGTAASGSNSELQNPGNSNTPATPIAGMEYFLGRASGGGLNTGQTKADIAFQDGLASGGFRHFLQTQHNAAASSDGNAFLFYCNNSTTAGGSSAVGAGNVLCLWFTPNKVVAPAALVVTTGLFMSSGQVLSWNSDTGISRDSAGVLDIGTSGAASKAGSINLTNLTATGAVSGATYATATNCSATGTAASPSVASCSAAAAGAFSCATNASAATCTINTTAVTANSEIFVQEVADEGTRLSVTCNTAPSVTPAILLATKTAGVGFTINMPTITTNPACFDYHIVN